MIQRLRFFGLLLLVAGCGGLEPAVELPTPPPAPAAVPAEVAKHPAKTIRITVRGPVGEPMENVLIQPAVWTEEEFKEKDLVTDEDGHADIELPRTFYILRVWAWKEGHVPLFAHWEEEELAAGTQVVPGRFTFNLRKGTTIGGFILNEDGKPIEGARVEVMLHSEDGAEERRVSDSIWLAYGTGARTTDKKGFWSLHNVPKGDGVGVSMKLTHSDYVSDRSWGGLQEEQAVTMRDFRDRKAKIVMSRGTSIVGTVTDAGGKPVPDAVIVWSDDPYFDTGSNEVATDKKGGYRCPPLPDGARNLTVIAKGWAPTIRKVEVSRTMQPCDFQLKAGKTVRIRFFDLSGKPIPKVYVAIKGWRDVKSLYNHDHPNVLDTAIPRQADDTGLFEWTWAPDDKVTYEFAIEEYEMVEEKAVAPSDEDHVITLVEK